MQDLHPDINFKIEIDDNEISFLDMKVIKCDQRYATHF